LIAPFFRFDNSVWKVVEFLHVKPGKGSAFVRSKLKNLETGNTLDKTWKSGESFGDAQVDKEDMQFSYQDDEDMVFMNMETFEEVRVLFRSAWLTLGQRCRSCASHRPRTLSLPYRSASRGSTSTRPSSSRLRR